MQIFLLKTEPDEFSYADLISRKREPWDGVRNPAAQKCMRTARKGDRAFIYHTGNERRVAGLARIVRGAYPDPDHPGQTAEGEPKFVLLDVAPLAESTATLTLKDIKADDRFTGFVLVRQSRLSVMHVPPDLAAIVCEGAGLPPVEP